MDLRVLGCIWLTSFPCFEFQIQYFQQKWFPERYCPNKTIPTMQLIQTEHQWATSIEVPCGDNVLPRFATAAHNGRDKEAQSVWDIIVPFWFEREHTQMRASLPLKSDVATWLVAVQLLKYKKILSSSRFYWSDTARIHCLQSVRFDVQNSVQLTRSVGFDENYVSQCVVRLPSFKVNPQRSVSHTIWIWVLQDFRTLNQARLQQPGNFQLKLHWLTKVSLNAVLSRLTEKRTLSFPSLPLSGTYGFNLSCLQLCSIYSVSLFFYTLAAHNLTVVSLKEFCIPPVHHQCCWIFSQSILYRLQSGKCPKNHWC